MNIFEKLEKDGFCKKTKYCYMLNNCGHYIYKFKNAQLRNLFLQKFEQKEGTEVKKIKTDKVFVICFNDVFIGVCE